MQKQEWEYKVVDLIKEIEKEGTKTRSGSAGQWLQASDLEGIFNKLGAEGWELVAVQFILERRDTVVVGFFKRPL